MASKQGSSGPSRGNQPKNNPQQKKNNQKFQSSPNIRSTKPKVFYEVQERGQSKTSSDNSTHSGKSEGSKAFIEKESKKKTEDNPFFDHVVSPAHYEQQRRESHQRSNERGFSHQNRGHYHQQPVQRDFNRGKDFSHHPRQHFAHARSRPSFAPRQGLLPHPPRALQPGIRMHGHFFDQSHFPQPRMAAQLGTVQINKHSEPIRMFQPAQNVQVQPVKVVPSVPQSKSKKKSCLTIKIGSGNNSQVIKYRNKKAKTEKCPKQKFIAKDRSRKQKQTNLIDSDCNAISATPLLSFHRDTTKKESDFNLMEFSDEEEKFVPDSPTERVAESFDLIDLTENVSSHSLSQPESLSQDLNMIDSPLINFDRPENTLTDSDSSDDDSDYTGSIESEVISETSLNSSIIGTESSFNLTNYCASEKEFFVSVFWDIENCPLPSKKSAIDFVCYVREHFYEGRLEDEFAAACDVSKLSKVLVKELDEASVTIMHISSLNKNAADKRIESCLQRFQNRYHNSNAAVVLISSDSDFLRVLHDMRYKHNIFVNLICNNQVKRSLLIEAHKYVFLEDIVESLPDRCSADTVQHILSVTNLPDMKAKSIRKSLQQKLKSFNCRTKVIQNPFSAEIIFQDHSVCDQALGLLKDFYLGGKALVVQYNETQLTDSKIKKAESSSKMIEEKTLLIDLSSNSVDMSQNTKSTDGQPATLCVFVLYNIGNTEYWRTSLNDILKHPDFSLSWDSSSFEGCLLIKFESLKKARKGMKILQFKQLSDEKAPKFLKLLKNEDDVTLNMDAFKFNPNEVNKKKIADQLQTVRKKATSLQTKHLSMINGMKPQSKSVCDGVSEAVNAKLLEYEEQLKNFEKFSRKIIDQIENLDFQLEDLDERLHSLKSDFVRECNSFAEALPIYAKKDLILNKVIENQVIVIRAETGSGKSTQLVQYIWKEKILFGNGKIVCTQPRKIAAMSLAKHVSTQIGCAVGDIVGYQVGLNKKTSDATKILFVTDLTMLKILISEGLNDVACLIIDEAHERTIFTDILLGMIKKDLPLNPFLKVIITSATIDTTIFQNYFSLSDDTILNISGRTFPVEDIWLEKAGNDYFHKTLDVAFSILSEEPGDILCFLVTPLETEKAVEEFNERLKPLKTTKEADKVRAFSLHGQLNPNEQQKVFEKTPAGFRKVIFATNCAETSITIPGIKFVVDCGMVKESQFDSKRNMNVLTVDYVSKSSAVQRKGRAGRTQPGKCYHIYSKTTFDKMNDTTNPEILRTNLCLALLKMMKMGVHNPVQFDFVQSPPIEKLNASMEQLLHLNAVDERTRLLTDLGKRMAVLSLEPRLSHLIFQGFDHSVAYEAIVIAALLTMSSTIFFRNSENQDEADKKKRRFCEPENDFLMFLEVYKEWNSLPKHLKSQWCVTNCINARSMRIVHELINEITLTLANELGDSYQVKTKFQKDSNKALMKILFKTFSKNLAVYSGHYKFGYKSLYVSDCLIIHPSSSLCAFGRSLPKFLIFETILKTSQTFILNICPITEEMVFEAIDSGVINHSIQAFNDLVATEFCIKPLGGKVIFENFIGKKGAKRKEVITRVRNLIKSDLVEVDINIQKGFVTIIGYGSRFEDIPSIVIPGIENTQNRLMKESKEICFTKDRCSFMGILISGGLLKDVILPGEFRDVKVILNGSETIEIIAEKLSAYGNIKEVREWKKYFKITYELPSSAQRALEYAKTEYGFSVQSMQNNVLDYNRNYLYKVFMRFLRRKSKGIAYFGLNQPLSSFLLPSLIKYKGIYCSLKINKKSGDIQVTSLPPDVEKKELEKIISGILPADYKITKALIPRDKEYQSSPEEIKSVKENIISLFSEFTFKENIHVDLKKPNSKDIIWSAIVYFQNSQDGETAVSVLRSRSNPSNFSGGIVLKPELQTYLYCKKDIYLAVEKEIKEAVEFFKNDVSVDSRLDITALQKGDRIEIKIVSNNISDITDARRSINTILLGDEVKFSDPFCNKILFTESGKALVNSLSKMFPECCIFQNVYNRTITLYGRESACNVIKMQINAFLKDLENLVVKDISLKVDSGKSILKELFKNYGYDLLQLKEECKLSNIEVNKYKQILMVQGDSSSVSKCEVLVESLKKAVFTENLDSVEEICPVCYDEVSPPAHRLESCGHAYCKECLLHLFQSSDTFPLKCDFTKDNKVCDSLIVVADLDWALTTNKSLLQSTLYERILRSFVEEENDISYCPYPNCSMIYRTTGTSNIFKCPGCFNDICVKCQALYHVGYSCNLYQLLKDKTVDSLKAWMDDCPSQRKLCPSCSSPIEKNGGCNHMTCWKCQCHMCWLCLKVFSSGRDVYNHLPTCPKYGA